MIYQSIAGFFLFFFALFNSAFCYYSNAPAFEREEEFDPFHVDAGFILEQARVALIPYAVSTTTDTHTVSLFYPNPKLSFGVTCGLGYDFSHNDWSAKAHLDWLQTTQTGSAAKISNANLTPTHFDIRAITGGSPNSAENANSTVDISYFVLKLDLERGINLKNSIKLASHAGLKLAFIYGGVTNEYTGGAIPLDEMIKEVASTDFWGMGPNIGLNAEWFFMKNVGFLFDVNIATLVSYVTVSGDLSYSLNSSSSLTNLAYSVPTFTSTIRTLFGLMYDQPIFSGTQVITAKLGWDTTMYWSQFFLLLAGNTGSTNGLNFGLTGLFFDLGWSF